MSRSGRLTELESLRRQVADLAQALRDLESPQKPQQNHLREETLEDLREQARLLRTIIEGTAADTGDEFFASLVQHLTGDLGVQYAIIGEVLTGVERRTLRTLAISAGGTLIDNFEYALDHAPCGTGLTQSFWCFEQGVQARFPHFPNLAALNVESHCGVSIRNKEGAVIGMMIVMDTKPLSHTGRLQSLMEVFASRAAAELHRHKAEVAQRQIEQTLRESEERFRTFLDHAPNLAFVKSNEGRYLFTNRRFEDLFGIPRDGALGKTDEELFPPAQAAMFRANDRRVLETGEPLECEEVAWLPDGPHTSIAVKFPLRDAAGRLYATGGITTDITDRKQAENVLARQTQHLVTAQALAHVGSWEWNLETDAVTWSQEHYRIFGQPPMAATLTSDAFFAALHPDDRDRIQAAVHDSLVAGLSFDVECRILRPNGEVRVVHSRGEVLRDATGRPISMAGTIQDITERKQVLDALKTSEERWHLAVQGSNDGIWDWDIRTGRVFFSGRWKAMRGYDDPEVTDSPDEWKYSIHPDDRDRVMRALDNYLARQRPDYCEEYRTRRRDGSYMWVLDRGIALWDAEGRPVRMAGSETDITEQKRAAEDLHRTAETLRTVVQSAPVAIVTCNAEGRLTSWNPAAERIFGWSEEDMLGQPLLAVPPGREQEAERLWRQTLERQAIDGLELQRCRKDGTLVNIHLWAGALLDATGTMIGALAVMADVTEQKRDAEALAQRERQFRTVLDALPIGVWFTDAQGKVLLANPAARQLWTGAQRIGIGKEGAPELNWWDTVGQAAEPHRWLLSDVLTGGTAASDDTLEITCEDGTRKMFRNSAVPVRSDDGSIQGAVLLNEDITGRVRAEQERARTQGFLESIIENIPHMITVKDAQDLRFVTVNRAAERVFERSRADLIGRSVFDVLPEAEATQMYASDLDVLERTRPLEMSAHVVHSPSGEGRVLHTKKLPIFAGQDRPEHLLTISEDITARTQAESVDRQRVAQLIRFQEAQLRFSKLTHRNLKTDFQLISQATAEALAVERVSIWLLNDSRTAMVCRDLYTLSGQQHQSGTALEALRYPRYFAALESALIVAAHDSCTDPRIQEFAEHLEALHITSRLDVPIRQGGLLIGVLCHEHVGAARDWSSEEETFAISVADQAALCLAAAERRRIEAALRASEERFAKAFRSSPHPVIIADVESGVIIEANDAAYALFGYEPKDVEGRTALEIGLWPCRQDRTRYREELRRRGSVRNLEAVLRMKTGALRQCLLSSELIELNGRRCTVTVGTDITDQKHAEEALRQSEARFRTMAEAIPQQVWTATPDGNLDYVNERCLEYFLTTAESLIGSNWQQVIHPDDLPLCLERWSAARATGQPYQVEFRLRRASDQTYRWHIARALPLRNSEDRVIKWVGTNTDVTDVKRAEEALLAREQDLRHAMEERERISQDLHDGILQSLYAVGLGLEACKPLITAHRPEQALETTEQAIGQLNRVMAEVRNFIAGLESEALQEGTFETALRTVINTVTQAHPIDCRIHIEQDALGYIPLDRALQLLNIVREALSNVVRHAQASHVSVSVRRLRRTIRVRVHDNGVGFNPKTAAGTGHGLQNMAARAKKMRVEFELHSAIGDGTTIILDLPKEEVYVHS